ncbi:PH domain-containing protein [Methanoculleus sp. Wushi-C6]|uniref:PH domain-containing protein n=1 Tax=Methanoculleus caldifontis TaxID=2651577 RepID=A0ABU3WXJ1_9EURY|nr:PH domain-containing protein [Methanoculleus sp. Wushi-C6]MDV2480518.1 PH domain-containing protein [Methanoculleus sp. Wushi-C6]
MPLTPLHIGEAFKPAPQFRSYLYASLGLAIAVFVLPWFVPLVALSPAPIALAVTLPVVGAFVFVVYWIPLYYESIVYRLTVTEITWQRGVWFRQTGIVPYNRITNVDISQGPLMRYFAFSAVKVQTAGYSAQAQAEIVLTGIEDPKDVQEKIMNFVRTVGPVAVDGGAEQPPALPAAGEIVEELRAIRQLLESRQER